MRALLPGQANTHTTPCSLLVASAEDHIARTVQAQAFDAEGVARERGRHQDLDDPGRWPVWRGGDGCHHVGQPVVVALAQQAVCLIHNLHCMSLFNCGLSRSSKICA